MVKRHAIIRTLPSVETLGSANIICADKTGTLTQNKMTVVSAYVNHKKDLINRILPADELSPEKYGLLSVSVLCADASLSVMNDGSIDYSGDPTETALLELGVFYGLFKDKFEDRYPRVAEIPFDSERRRMSTVNRMSETSFSVNVKGGLEEILGACDRIVLNGEIKPITDHDIDLIRKSNDEMAGSALRVLAMASKDLSEVPLRPEADNLENELVFIGLLGMIDPARPEVLDAVHKCNTAGIRPVMITGDHVNTALAIARELNIFRDGNVAITGAELEKLSDEELAANVSKYSVYARVAPEHKVRIVRAWQSHNQIVAMTGDGVNDAPALKQADIGAAMGITGTDDAKGAADMVLTDDNFATIVSAVEEGRRIYDNILKAIQFLISSNVGEIFLLLVTSVFNLGAPLLPIHILWVNLVTDSFPALALSFDPAEKDIMKRKPRQIRQGFMTKGMVYRIFYQGLMIGAIPLAAFLIGLYEQDLVLGQTMAFATLMLAQLTHVRNMHSNTKLSFAINPMNNKPLVGAVLISAALALAVLLVPPVRDAFRLTAMDGKHWVIVILMSFIPIVVVNLFKLLKINTVKEEKQG
jgi:Ca2+-transporting ATPase